MPTHPRLTIITPSLNHAAYLERTICSVLDQDWDNVEYMIVDGGSTDGSLDIIRDYADELAWWCVEPDSGPAEAINRALERATGDVVGILAADDLYLPETLRRVAERFAQDDAPRWLVGHCLRISPRDGELGRMEAALPHSLDDYLMHNSGLLPQSATFYQRTLFETYGRFDANLRYAYGYEMACRLLAAGEMPALTAHLLAARRESHAVYDFDRALRCGREDVEAAMYFADQLPMSRRYALWRNGEQRRRIYALAEAEAHASAARRLLWQRLLHHPWWLADSTYRHALLHGTHHTDDIRPPLSAA